MYIDGENEDVRTDRNRKRIKLMPVPVSRTIAMLFYSIKVFILQVLTKKSITILNKIFS